MNQSSTAEPACEPSNIAGRDNGSRFYACVITIATVLLIGMLLWPLTVHTFRSTASFEIGYDSASGLAKSSLNQQVISAMRDATQAEVTMDLIRALKSPIKSPILKSPDSERLREIISIKGRPGRNANSIEYLVEFSGSGGHDEVEFLNALVVKINSFLDNRVAGSTAKMAVTELSDEFSRFHSGTIEQFATQVNEVLSKIETANNDLQIISNDLSNWRPGSTSEFGNPLGQFDTRRDGDELTRLNAERTRLLSQPGITPYHYQVTALQKQIEALQNRSDAGVDSVSPPLAADSNASTIRNQFVSDNRDAHGSAANKADTAVARVVREIATINLGSTASELGALGERIVESGNNAALLTKRMAERAEGLLEVTSPIIMQDFRKATASIPVGGTPTGRSFIWLSMIAGMIGVAVALNYDPSLNVRRFRSLDHLQNCLGIPVIGSVRSRPAIQAPRSTTRRLAAMVVRIGEWTLLLAVVLLIVAALFNSQVAAAFLENPFHGVTRTVWMMTSHG